MKDLVVGICVEGQTESMFVKYVLARYLKQHNITLGDPINLNGNIGVSRLANLLSLMASKYDYITTLCDLYGFQNRLPNETHSQLEKRILSEIPPHLQEKVIPYVQKYEFESLLYSNIDIMCENLASSDLDANNLKQSFQDDVGNREPEDINDSIDTAPSKRIKKIFKKYKKSVYGYIIAQEIGVTQIKDRCPNFSQWVDGLVKLHNR